MELLIGCGRARDKRLVYATSPKEWTELVTLDNNPRHCPNVVHDLRQRPWPFDDDTFDEVHAYEVLEHLGTLGDGEALFADFFECWRVLKPGGILCATVPHWQNYWAFGDPTHSRVINHGTLVFLDRKEYVKQVDGWDPDRQVRLQQTPMSDYRDIWHGDFVRVGSQYLPENFAFFLEAQKPARTWEVPGV